MFNCVFLVLHCHTGFVLDSSTDIFVGTNHTSADMISDDIANVFVVVQNLRPWSPCAAILFQIDSGAVP